MPFKSKTAIGGVGSGCTVRPNVEYDADELDAMIPDWRNYLAAGVIEAVGEAPETATKPKAKRRTATRKKATAE